MTEYANKLDKQQQIDKCWEELERLRQPGKSKSDAWDEFLDRNEPAPSENQHQLVISFKESLSR